MIFHPVVALGVVALCLPVWMLRARGSRLVGFDQRRWPSSRNLALAIFDAMRASVGTWALLQSLPQLGRIDAMGNWQDAAFLALAVAAGATVQTLTWMDEDFVFAPVPFLIGVAAVSLHPLVLLISIPLALGGALAIRAWSTGFIGGGIGIAVAGLAATAQDWRLAVLLGVAWCCPVLASVLAGRHIGWPKN